MRSFFTHHASRITFALAFLTLLLATAWSPPPQEEEIAVVGQVTNGTPGGTVPSDLEVMLRIFSDVEEKGTYTTTLSADGSFRFDSLVLEEEDAFVARVVYQDVAYVSDLATFEPGQPEAVATVTIYETTEDSSAIQVAQMHVFLSMLDDRLQIGEYFLISNAGDRTYVGKEDSEAGQRTTLSFILPEGAEGLSFDDSSLGERYLEWEGGFADTEPVIPGIATAEVLLGYELSYQEGMQVKRAFDVPVASVVLLLSEEGIALEGEGVSADGILDTQMGPAFSYTAGPLAVGEPLVFTLVARPQSVLPSAPFPSAPAGSAPVRNAARETSVGLVTLAVSVAVVYWLWRSPAPGPPPAQARSLVEAIAALDADFEAGQVREGAYRKKRRTLKRRLRTLLGGGKQEG